MSLLIKKITFKKNIFFLYCTTFSPVMVKCQITTIKGQRMGSQVRSNMFALARNTLFADCVLKLKLKLNCGFPSFKYDHVLTKISIRYSSLNES